MISLWVLLISWCALAQPQEAARETQPYGESFTVYIDNDSRNVGGPNADQGYTNGVRFSYVYAQNDIPKWVPSWAWTERVQHEFRDATSNFGVSLAQQIYTPNDMNNPQLITNDRPYAGYLYAGVTAAFKTSSHHHLFEVDVGVIGPEAMGESVQNGFHQVIDVATAKGWEHQLRTEPTLQFFYTQKVRFVDFKTKKQRRYFDVIPEAGAAFGNVFVHAHAGAMMRFGVRIPDDFGPSSLATAGGDSIPDLKLTAKNLDWRAYFFAGLRGRVVAQNIFLDGNNFRRSHRVTKYPFVVENELGYAVQVSHWSFSWRFVTLSPEFEENSEVDSYASMALSYLKSY